jgi:hypothetical protein
MLSLQVAHGWTCAERLDAIRIVSRNVVQALVRSRMSEVLTFDAPGKRRRAVPLSAFLRAAGRTGACLAVDSR